MLSTTKTNHIREEKTKKNTHDSSNTLIQNWLSLNLLLFFQECHLDNYLFDEVIGFADQLFFRGLDQLLFIGNQILILYFNI